MTAQRSSSTRSYAGRRRGRGKLSGDPGFVRQLKDWDLLAEQNAMGRLLETRLRYVSTTMLSSCPLTSRPQSPPFRRQCLMKWDSEVVTEGTTHCPGWRGERFEVPEDMQSPSWPGFEAPTSFYTPACQHIDSPTTAFGPEPFNLSSREAEHCHYFTSLWSPLAESAEPGLRKSVGTPSSSTTPIDLSDYASVSERSSITGTELSERDRPATPPLARKRLRTEDLIRSGNYSRESKRTRRSRSLEPITKYGGGQTSWVTRRVYPPSPKPNGKEKAPPPLIASLRESSPLEFGLPTLSPGPKKPAAGSGISTTGSPHKRTLTFADPRRPSPSTRRTLAIDSRRGLRPEDEKRCSVVIKDGDEEDKVWYMSREALQDVKGYLQVKKATGAAMEMPLEKDVRHSSLRVERVLRLPSTRPIRKRTSALEDNDEGARKPKRRRSWPEIDPYASKPRTGSLLCSS